MNPLSLTRALTLALTLFRYGDQRTLYGRGGGVFGLAKLADRLMDTWMANDVLNGNAKVATWTESGQRQGFKFLVTQVCGDLTGLIRFDLL